MDELHICNPPMEQRPISVPAEWQCPECGTWWAAEPSLPPQVAPTYDFLAHQSVVPARWILKENG